MWGHVTLLLVLPSLFLIIHVNVKAYADEAYDKRVLNK